MNYKLLFTAIVMLVMTSATKKAEPDSKPQKLFCVYMVYNGFGVQKSLGSYTQTLIQPASCLGHDSLCFWVICGDNDGVIDQSEFLAAFEATDLVDTANDSLDDEQEALGVLEKLTLTK